MKKLVLFLVLLITVLLTATVSANQVLPAEVLNEPTMDALFSATTVETDCLALESEQLHIGKSIIDTNTLSDLQKHSTLYNVELGRKYGGATLPIVAVNIGFLIS